MIGMDMEVRMSSDWSEKKEKEGRENLCLSPLIMYLHQESQIAKPHKIIEYYIKYIIKLI
jgi:hypothetical protein